MSITLALWEVSRERSSGTGLGLLYNLSVTCFSSSSQACCPGLFPAGRLSFPPPLLCVALSFFGISMCSYPGSCWRHTLQLQKGWRSQPPPTLPPTQSSSEPHRGSIWLSSGCLTPQHSMFSGKSASIAAAEEDLLMHIEVGEGWCLSQGLRLCTDTMNKANLIRTAFNWGWLTGSEV